MVATSDAIAFLGAGMMGEGMASALLSAGHIVHVVAHQNRAPVDRLLRRGAKECPDLATAAARSRVILSCLPNSNIVENVFNEVFADLQPGTLWLDATTGDPVIARQLSARLTETGGAFVDAPVTGGPAESEAAELTSLVGCEAAVFPAINAIAATYSKSVHRMGGPGSGAAAKLLNNFVTQGTMVLLGQAFRTASKEGLDWDALYAAMSGGAGRSGTLDKAVMPALAGDLDGSRFTIGNAAKDLGYATALIGGGKSEIARVLHAELRAYVEGGHDSSFVSRQLVIAPDDPPHRSR